MANPLRDKSPVIPKMPKETELKGDSTQVGWTTNLLPKVFNTNAIIHQAFEPDFLKPEIKPLVLRYILTQPGDTLDDVV